MAVIADRLDEDFEGWYTAVRPRLVRTVTALVRDPGTAEEICAEAFTRAYGRWGHVCAQVRDRDAWLFTVALNLVRRSWRSRLRPTGRALPLAGGTGGTGGEPIEPTTDHVPDVDLWRLVHALPARQRQVVLLRYVGDLTEPAIAEVLRLSPGSVSASLTKARATLRDRLVQEDRRG